MPIGVHAMPGMVRSCHRFASVPYGNRAELVAGAVKRSKLVKAFKLSESYADVASYVFVAWSGSKTVDRVCADCKGVLVESPRSGDTYILIRGRFVQEPRWQIREDK